MLQLGEYLRNATLKLIQTSGFAIFRFDQNRTAKFGCFYPGVEITIFSTCPSEKCRQNLPVRIVIDLSIRNVRHDFGMFREICPKTCYLETLLLGLVQSNELFTALISDFWYDFVSFSP